MDHGLVDPGRLARWMDEQDLAGRGEPVNIASISGGASNEIVLVRRGEHRFVLRRPPRAVPSGRNETMLREYRVLAALNGTDVPHPEAIAVCADEGVIGAWFYLMGYVDGWSPMSSTTWPAPFEHDLDARRGLAFELVEGIARLSKVDWRARGLDGFGKPDGFHERQVDRWYAHLARFQFREIPGLDVAAEWLRAHKPRAYSPGIIHGDYQFANVMFGHGAPSRLAAIVDWEMSTIGDPLLDLGWLLAGWSEDGEPLRFGSKYLTDRRGLPSRAALAARYAEGTGRALDALDFYVVLALFKLACVLEGSYHRFATGKSTHPMHERMGPLVLDLAQQARATAGV